MSEKDDKSNKPRMVLQMIKPGESIEEALKEFITMNPDVELKNKIDNPEEIQKVLESVGMSIDDLEDMVEGNKNGF